MREEEVARQSEGGDFTVVGKSKYGCKDVELMVLQSPA